MNEELNKAYSEAELRKKTFDSMDEIGSDISRILSTSWLLFMVANSKFGKESLEDRIHIKIKLMDAIKSIEKTKKELDKLYLEIEKEQDNAHKY